MTGLTQPLVSILTPSFNQGRFIGDTLASVRRQDYPNVEHIVVDGGSRDETLRVLRRYADGIDFVSEPDDGQADALNKAYSRSSGSILGWLNSDDFYVWEGVITAAVDFFETNRDIDVVYGHAIWVDEQNRVVKLHPRPPFSAARLRRMGFISQPATFFRRPAADRLVDTSLRFALDYWIWLRLLDEGCRFWRLDSYLAAMRYHPQAKSVHSRDEMWREDALIRAARGAPTRGALASIADLAVMAGMKAKGLAAYRRQALHPDRWCVPLTFPRAHLRPLFQAGLAGSSGTTFLLPRYLASSKRLRP